MAGKAANSRNITNSRGEVPTSSASAEVIDAIAPAAAPPEGQPAAADTPSVEVAGDEAVPPAPAPQAGTSKVGRIRALLASPAGASLPALCVATGWQSHSVRAALTGLRKAGAAIEKGKAENGATVYRIAAKAEEGR